MGDFRMTVEGTGGHGCERKAKEGEDFFGCGRMDCPDCLFAEFVAKMKRIGSVSVATMHHWPADMVVHVLSKDGTCLRCGATDADYNGKPSIRPLSKPCREYSAAQEVIDDYTEREAKYGGQMRATGHRVKGHF
jgi:hypothetical protein